MKKRLLLMLLFVGLTCLGQESIVIGKQDGIEISYQLTPLEKGAKKDKYLVAISAVNKGNEDLYYGVAIVKDANGQESFGLIPQLGFSKITIRNSTGWFGDGKDVMGEQTIYRTEDNANLFVFLKGKILNFEFEFNTKTGIAPIITNSYVKALRPISGFNIALNDAAVNGTWISSCGNSMNSLVFAADASGQFINQSVNGRQFKWIRRSVSEFVKDGDANSVLTYNKASNTFTYSNAEGVYCEWNKKQ